MQEAEEAKTSSMATMGESGTTGLVTWRSPYRTRNLEFPSYDADWKGEQLVEIRERESEPDPTTQLMNHMQNTINQSRKYDNKLAKLLREQEERSRKWEAYNLKLQKACQAEKKRHHAEQERIAREIEEVKGLRKQAHHHMVQTAELGTAETIQMMDVETRSNGKRYRRAPGRTGRPPLVWGPACAHSYGGPACAGPRECRALSSSPGVSSEVVAQVAASLLQNPQMMAAMIQQGMPLPAGRALSPFLRQVFHLAIRLLLRRDPYGITVGRPRSREWSLMWQPAPSRPWMFLAIRQARIQDNRLWQTS